MLIFLAQRIHEKRDDVNFSVFTSLTMQSAFRICTYSPRQYDKWIFPAPPTNWLSVAIAILLGLAYLIIVGFTFSLSFYLIADIYKHPTLGKWSYVILAYSCIAFLGNLCLAIHINLPLPYRDKSELKRLGELEKTDPRAARELRNKLSADRRMNSLPIRIAAGLIVNSRRPLPPCPQARHHDLHAGGRQDRAARERGAGACPRDRRGTRTSPWSRITRNISAPSPPWPPTRPVAWSRPSASTSAPSSSAASLDVLPAAEIEEIAWVAPHEVSLPLAPLTRDHLLPIAKRQLEKQA